MNAHNGQQKPNLIYQTQTKSINNSTVYFARSFELRSSLYTVTYSFEYANAACVTMPLAQRF